MVCFCVGCFGKLEKGHSLLGKAFCFKMSGERPPTAPVEKSRSSLGGSSSSSGGLRGRPQSSHATMRVSKSSGSLRQKKRRPATSTGASSSSTLSRSRTELSRNIKDITGHLEELQQRGMYMEAAKVRDELSRLKSSFRDEESQKWIRRHTRSLKALKN